MRGRFSGFILLMILFTGLLGMNVYAESYDYCEPASVTESTKYDISEVTELSDFSSGAYFGEAVTLATNTDQTGLFESQLSGYALAIYQGLKSVKLSPEVNGASFYVTGTANQSANAIYNLYRGAYATALYAYERDHQDEVIWAANKIRIGASFASNTATITVSYTPSAYATTSVLNTVNAKINSIVNGCNATSRSGKVKYYHDWLVKNNSYDKVYGSVGSDDGSKGFYYAHSAVGCLINGKGVCESYSKAFKIFCIRENIPCLLITSDTHEWNYVKLEDGKWYMVDCTYDDPINGGGVSYKYYLVSNYPYVDGDHRPDGAYVYPYTVTSKKANKISANEISVTISATARRVSLGASCQGSAALSFKSNRAEISVDGKGNVTSPAYYVGVSYITITSSETGTYYGASKTVKVSVLPYATSLKSASNSGKKKMTVKWKKNTSGNGYVIEYSTNKSFAGSLRKVVYTNAATSIKISGLKKGKTYYVRIMTMKVTNAGYIYSKWSATKKVKIKK